MKFELQPAANADAWIWALPETERLRLDALRRAFAEIARAKNPSRGVLAALETWDGEPISAPRLRALYDAWRKAGGDWHVCVRNWRGRHSGLPKAFAKWFPSLYMQTCRNDTFDASVRRLKTMWLANEPIPGYGRLADWWPLNRPGRLMPHGKIARAEFCPEGWSTENLRRLVKRLPHLRAVSALAKRGFHAAHGALPQLLRDRSRLRPLELVTCDDWRLDIQAVYRNPKSGESQIVYVNAIVVIDVATGVILASCLKPRWQRDDATHVGLCREDTKFTLLQVFRHGLPRGYKVRFLLENASATLAPEEQRALQGLLEGRVEIEHTGMARRELYSGGWREQSGMPYQKGWIEALFALCARELNALRGSTGNRYDNNPATLAARVEGARALIAEADRKRINHEDLKLPLLRFDEVQLAFDDMVRRLNWRTNHSLQGFRTIDEWHTSDGRFLPLAALEGVAPEARIVSRMESPAERWLRLYRADDYDTVPTGALLPLFADKRTVRVRAGRIEIRDKAFGCDRLVYTCEDCEALAHDGAVYLAAFEPDRSMIHLWTQGDYRYAGSVPRLGLVDAGDRHAILKRSGEVHRSRMALAAEAARLLQDVRNADADARAHNDAVFAAKAAHAAALESRRAELQAAARAKTLRLQDADLVLPEPDGTQDGAADAAPVPPEAHTRIDEDAGMLLSDLIPNHP